MVTVKLTDFGFAIHADARWPLARVGTTDFMAPEMIMIMDSGEVGERVFRDKYPKASRPAYGASADVWAMGVLVYELVTRSPPFAGADEQAIIDAIERGEYRMPPTATPAMRDFLLQTLALDPLQRGRAADLMHHPLLRAHENDETRLRLAEAGRVRMLPEGAPLRPSCGWPGVISDIDRGAGGG